MMPQFARCSTLAIIACAAGSAPAQSDCQPWFQHQQLWEAYSRGALLDLDPEQWLTLVGVEPGVGLELWQFHPDGPATQLGTIAADLDDALAAADFDDDGDTDLAARRTDTGSIHIFTNAGGTLTEGPGTMAPLGVMAALDYDLDGLPDLVIATETDVVLYRNAGDGTFTELTSIALDGSKRAVFPAAVDHDALPDLLVRAYMNPGYRLTTLRQKPDGTLETLAHTTVSWPLVAGDINADGLTDIAYAPRSTALADGGGSFTPGPELDSHVDEPVSLGDLDRDGDFDLLVNTNDHSVGTNNYGVLLNDGGGVFTMLDRPDGRTALWGLALVDDVNRDGNADVVADRGELTDLRLGSGDGYFDDVPILVLYQDWCRRVALGDLDADGDLDAVSVGDGPGRAMVVLENDGTGTLGIAAQPPTPTTIYERPATADFDNDGDLDILLWTDNQGLWIYENTPDGQYAQASVIPHWGGGALLIPFVGDFNADGLPDIVATDREGSLRGYTVHLNQGGGAFARSFTEQPDADLVLAVADFDGDGLDDLLNADTDSGADELQVCYGAGDGVFQAPLPTGANGNSSPFAVPGDFNGDGSTDFVSYGYLSSRVELYINQGGGSFAQTWLTSAHRYPRDPGVADLDGDGADELVIGAQSGFQAAIYSFDSHGQLTRAIPFGNAARTILGTPTGDMNGDGAIDIVMATHANYGGNPTSGGVSVFLNQCPGSPCPADFNHDGALDTRDFIAYLAAWADQRDDDCSQGGCSADFNADGTVDTRDFLTFLTAYAAGC